MLIFGVQSADPGILAGVRRTYGGINELPSIMLRARQLEICTVLEFIFGLSGETRETLNRTLSFARKARPNVVQFNLLKLIEGTESFNRSKSGDIFTEIPQKELRRIILVEYFRYFLSPGVLFRNLLFIVRNNPRYLLSAGNLLWYPFAMAVRSIRLKEETPCC